MPLQGLSVVELGVAMAGPFCAMTLADYGAEVVKVEKPDGGDESRHWGPFLNGGLSHYFAAVNRNKKSVVLDIKTPPGRAAFLALVKAADVLIDNFRPGLLDAIGLGFDRLSELNPRLVYCSISGFGAQGPRRGDRANDMLMQAFAGVMSLTGDEHSGPVRSGMSVADVGAGLFALSGILMALEQRHRTGRGQKVSTSLLEGQLAMLTNQISRYFATGQNPSRSGSGSQLAIPYQAFAAQDDWIVVAAFTERMWQGVCRALDMPHWCDEPRYKDGAARLRHKEELLALLTAVFKTRTAADWLARLSREGVPCSEIMTLERLLQDEQVAAVNMIEAVEHPVAGRVRMAGLPIKFSDAHGMVRTPPPDLGEHTAEILAGLDLTPDHVQAILDSAKEA